MDRRQALAVIAFFASLFALCVIGLGAFTRLIDAGLGCPDWPGCYGHIIAPLNSHTLHLDHSVYPHTPIIAYKAWAEMVHRYFAGALATLSLIVIGLIFIKVRTRSNIILASFLSLMVAYQITLGAWTVTLKLLPIIVSQHLLGGYLILSLLWLIYLNNKKSSIELLPRRVKIYLSLAAIFAVILFFFQIMLGAWTSTNYASLSCPDFPFCSNSQTLTLHLKAAYNLFSPTGINYAGGVLAEPIRQTIQMMHRFGALVCTIYLFIFTLFAQTLLKNCTQLAKKLYLALGLLCLQLCLGISNVIFKLPLANAISHTLVAVLLFITLITLTYQLITAPQQP